MLKYLLNASQQTTRFYEFKYAKQRLSCEIILKIFELERDI